MLAELAAAGVARGDDVFKAHGGARKVWADGPAQVPAAVVDPDLGEVGGRPTVTPEIIRAARDMNPNPDASVTSIANLLGVSPGTLYNHIPDLRELRAARRLRHQIPPPRQPRRTPIKRTS